MSTCFSLDWLRLREAADHQSRPSALLPPLLDWLPREPLSIIDLGAGSGSNMRYLAPRLPGAQHWTLVDNDSVLLRGTEAPLPHVAITTRERDIGDGLSILEATPHMITASALLDLVSRSWLEMLATLCLDARCAALFSLTYDGRIRWNPADSDDALVAELVNAHQRRDKGFGPALGPGGAETAASVFRDRGFHIRLSPSPWRLTADDADLQTELLNGWLEAALEQAPPHEDRLQAWARRRREAIGAGGPNLTVGHLDLLALPPER